MGVLWDMISGNLGEFFKSIKGDKDIITKKEQKQIDEVVEHIRTLQQEENKSESIVKKVTVNEKTAQRKAQKREEQQKQEEQQK